MSGNLQGVLTSLDLSGTLPIHMLYWRYTSRIRTNVCNPCPISSCKSSTGWSYPEYAQPGAVADPISLPTGATLRRIRLNYLWAFGYNTIMIPIAAGALYAPVRLQLPPWVAGAQNAQRSPPLCEPAEMAGSV